MHRLAWTYNHKERYFTAAAAVAAVRRSLAFCAFTQPPSLPASLPPPPLSFSYIIMSFNTDEVNILIHRYLVESGYSHAGTHIQRLEAKQERREGGREGGRDEQQHTRYLTRTRSHPPSSAYTSFHILQRRRPGEDEPPRS
jgi:hypothetical protein